MERLGNSKILHCINHYPISALQLFFGSAYGWLGSSGMGNDTLHTFGNSEDGDVVVGHRLPQLMDVHLLRILRNTLGKAGKRSAANDKKK